MANTLLTTELLLDVSNKMLADASIYGNNANMEHGKDFAAKVGDEIRYRIAVKSNGHLKSETGAIDQVTDITEVPITLKIEELAYDKVTLTDEELSWDINTFAERFIKPRINAIVRQEELYAKSVAGAFAAHMVGDVGTNPTTHDHLLAAKEELFINSLAENPSVGIITPRAYTNFRKLNISNSVDYGEGKPTALRKGYLTEMENTKYFRSALAGTFNRGAIAGTVLTNGAALAGVTVLPVDGLSGADATRVNLGARFVLTGDSTIYTVMERGTITGNAANLVIYPALAANVADDVAVTFQTAHIENYIYEKETLAMAVLPTADGPNVKGATITTPQGNKLGVSILTTDVDDTTLSRTMQWQCYLGGKVFQHERGVCMQGAS